LTFPGKRLSSLLFVLLWTLLVLYPRPADLATSICRLLIPPTDPLAAEKLIPRLPSRDDPALVEEFIMQEFPYCYDWQNYNLPWYFPTAEEAIEKGAGDCKTRFIILASTLEALDIPYEAFISPSHIWVYYQGKEENPVESRAAVLFYRDGGKLRFKLPEVNWRESLNVFYEGFWSYMPLRKKIILFSGFIFVLYFYIRCWDPEVGSRNG